MIQSMNNIAGQPLPSVIGGSVQQPRGVLISGDLTEDGGEEDWSLWVQFFGLRGTGGFGLLNLHGIAKPTYRAFELLHHLGQERLLVDGLHETAAAWITRGTNRRITVLLLNHALPRHAITTLNAHIHLATSAEPSRAWVERIDEDHANPKRQWQAIGSPEYLDRPALEQLHDASRLTRRTCSWARQGNQIHLDVELPPHSVAAITLGLTEP
jgi:xylan 1,4-beta-xylosidase